MFKKLFFLFISLSLVVGLTAPSNSYAISAHGAILMDQDSGRVLYAKNAKTKMRIASITKIMTAILAVEEGKLDDKVSISKLAANTEGSSIYLKPGDTMLLEDLLYGLMLRSGNDSAVAIAEHIGGDLHGFVKLMNDKAKEIGMKQTKFANPHGLDDHENHYSTAFDMALLTRYAQQNETFKKIFSAKVYKCEMPNGTTTTWHNKNRLLTGMYKYSTGGKTGYTKRAKRTLVSTAKKDGLSLIAVTLNAPNDWADHQSLFNGAFHQYEHVNIVKKGEVLEFSGLTDQKLKAFYDFSYPLRKSEKSKVTTSIDLYYDEHNRIIGKLLPISVGTLTIHLNNEKIASVPLFMYDR